MLNTNNTDSYQDSVVFPSLDIGAGMDNVVEVAVAELDAGSASDDANEVNDVLDIKTFSTYLSSAKAYHAFNLGNKIQPRGTDAFNKYVYAAEYYGYWYNYGIVKLGLIKELMRPILQQGKELYVSMSIADSDGSELLIGLKKSLNDIPLAQVREQHHILLKAAGKVERMRAKLDNQKVSYAITTANVSKLDTSSGRITSLTNLNGEKWVPLKGFEQTHKISNKGRLQSVARFIVDKRGTIREVGGRILIQRELSNKAAVILNNNTKNIILVVRDAVTDAFMGGIPEHKYCIHVDGDNFNCSIDNLKWVDFLEYVEARKLRIAKVPVPQENIKYSYRSTAYKAGKDAALAAGKKIKNASLLQQVWVPETVKVFEEASVTQSSPNINTAEGLASVLGFAMREAFVIEHMAKLAGESITEHLRTVVKNAMGI